MALQFGKRQGVTVALSRLYAPDQCPPTDQPRQAGNKIARFRSERWPRLRYVPKETPETPPRHIERVTRNEFQFSLHQ